MEADTNTAAARKSSRLAKKPKLVKDNTVHDREQDATPRRRRQGRLAGLLDLPVDVLYEIFGHLLPFDVLRLARTTKAFRRLLMRKSARAVWKKALDNVSELPPCPPDLTEPQWVNLAFDPHCHFCLATNVRNIEWRLRLRICGRCAKEKFEDIRNIEEWEHDEPLVNIRALIPHRVYNGFRRSFMLSQYLQIKKEYKALEDAEARKIYIKEREAIIAEIEQHSVQCEIWHRSQTARRTLELDDLREERLCMIKKKLIDLGWEQDLKRIRLPDSLRNLTEVRKPQRLTERTWTTIQPKVLEFMKEMRQKRLVREHEQLVLDRMKIATKILRDYKIGCLTDCILPDVIDFCHFEPIKKILSEPTEVTVDEKSFTEALKLVPTCIDKWRSRITANLICDVYNQGQDLRRLRARIRETMRHTPEWAESDDDGSDDDDDIPTTVEEVEAKLLLATSVFQCTRCSGVPGLEVQPLWFPRVLGHACLTRQPFRSWLQEHKAEAAYLENHVGFRRSKWTFEPIKYSWRMSKSIAAIVECAGYDPSCATVEDMNGLDIGFVCLHCTEDSEEDGESVETGVCMGWREAVLHHEHCHDSEEPRWVKLESDEIKEACLNYYGVPSYLQKDRSWKCMHCQYLPGEKEPCELIAIITHLASNHGISQCEMNRDYFRCYSAEPKGIRPCIVSVPEDTQKDLTGMMAAFLLQRTMLMVYG